MIKNLRDAGNGKDRNCEVKFYPHGIEINVQGTKKSIVVDLSDDKLSIYVVEGPGPEGPAIHKINLS